MAQERMFWKLAPSYLIIVAIATMLMTWLSLSLQRNGQDVWRLAGWMALLGLMTVVALMLVSHMRLKHHIEKPLRRIEDDVRHFALGQFDRSLPVSETIEVAGLVRALTVMSNQLDQRITIITRQLQERQAVLRSMNEGVLAVDTQERIIAINAMAAQFMQINVDVVLGQNLLEVVRNTQLQQLLAAALSGVDPIQGDITLRIEGEPRLIEARGSVMRNHRGESSGAVLVLNDVTRLRQLEAIRRDFVANVSHELKTPITAIKAAVETLIEEIEDQQDHVTRFLTMISRQSDRLNAIVEDLLTLARVEQGREGQMLVKQQSVESVVRAALETCSASAKSRHIEINAELDPSLQIKVNAALLEQAVVNLLDNAIKYTHENTQVTLRAEAKQNMAVISISDHGPGIEQEHLPRIFERFYRTDKARSRAMGGTGLGLAIVKHVAQIHGGKVSVDSSTGEDDHGSTFRVHLPLAETSL